MILNSPLHFSFERISEISGKYEISYDENGRLASRHNFTFQYDIFGRIQKVFNNGECAAIMFYGSFKEKSTPFQNTKLLMMVRNDEPGQEIIHYFYGNSHQPFQISAAFSTLHGWIKFYYDDKNRLFSMSQRNSSEGNTWCLYYIITDVSGTPTHILNSAGMYIKQITL